MIDVTLGGIDLSDACPEAVVTRVSRALLAQTRDEFMDVPGRAGSWVFPEAPGDQIITLNVSVLVDDQAERRAAMRALGDWCRTPDGPVALVLDDEPENVWFGVLEAGPPAEDDEYVGVTTISFRVGPFAFAGTPSVEELSLTGGSPKSGTFTIPDVLTAQPVIEITPTNGNISSLLFVLNGESMAWANPVVLASGSTLTISSLSDTITLGVNTDTELTGAFNPALVSMQSAFVSAFAELIPGTNAWSMSWVGTATTATVKLTWRERST